MTYLGCEFLCVHQWNLWTTDGRTCLSFVEREVRYPYYESRVWYTLTTMEPLFLATSVSKLDNYQYPERNGSTRWPLRNILQTKTVVCSRKLLGDLLPFELTYQYLWQQFTQPAYTRDYKGTKNSVLNKEVWLLRRSLQRSWLWRFHCTRNF